MDKTLANKGWVGDGHVRICRVVEDDLCRSCYPVHVSTSSSYFKFCSTSHVSCMYLAHPIPSIGWMGCNNYVPMTRPPYPCYLLPKSLFIEEKRNKWIDRNPSTSQPAYRMGFAMERRKRTRESPMMESEAMRLDHMLNSFQPYPFSGCEKKTKKKTRENGFLVVNDFSSSFLPLSGVTQGNAGNLPLTASVFLFQISSSPAR